MAQRPNPFEELEKLIDRLSRQLRSPRRSGSSGDADGGDLGTSVGSRGTGVDVTDANGEFVVVIDAPGFERDDIELTLTNRRLKIDGEREQAVDDAEDTYLRRERRTHSFSRQLTLPSPVDADGVEAHLNNGVVTIRLPKRDFDDAARSIDIE
ncbi:Hsp20/alpha crystallin family protein [Halostagnicola kamekurae]|uniref:HSP20 family protein n=1 Tax=Halostagnicola kamekurae TaxID=619731 RepID=A0A1I6SWX3_9EURY|nr:Hsp20/alpha crystallin family protein [Halostagnicola kamekurae]SFS81419.1 HSP20 family protein [Halostagnicola kamekurae]